VVRIGTLSYFLQHILSRLTFLLVTGGAALQEMGCAGVHEKDGVDWYTYFYCYVSPCKYFWTSNY